jgi:hypothetical protein
MALCAGKLPRIDTECVDRAGIGAMRAGQCVQQCGFARARRTDQRNLLALAD